MLLQYKFFAFVHFILFLKEKKLTEINSVYAILGRHWKQDNVDNYVLGINFRNLETDVIQI